MLRSRLQRQFSFLHSKKRHNCTNLNYTKYSLSPLEFCDEQTRSGRIAKNNGSLGSIKPYGQQILRI